ncbi:MAG: hypothetical protein HRT71_21165 [Flavobacteriales bacterium]|nr:hypothetical protein [Flavobacteriales bacterium]
MKITNIILCILFILFAAVQFNDVDPFGWIALYGFVAAVSGFAVVGKYNKMAIIAGGAICIVVSIYYVPGLQELFSEHEIGDLTLQMKADKTYIEESRESLGALIAFGALLFHYFKAKKVAA